MLKLFPKIALGKMGTVAARTPQSRWDALSLGPSTNSIIHGGELR